MKQKKTPLTRMRYWFIVNFSVLGLLIVGHTTTMTSLGVLAIVLLWLTIIITPLMLIPQVIENIIKEDPDWIPSVPKIVDISFDVVMTATIFSFSYPVLGLFYIVHIFMANKFKKDLLEQKRKSQKED